MYKLFVTAGLIALDVSLAFALPLQAQQVQTQKDCAATIADAQSTIETGRTIHVVTRRRDISDYPDHPDNRPYEYVFAMEGAATDTVMNSPKFMKIIATKIINNCGSVASVAFALNNSGWFYSVGLMPDGNIDFFDCFDHDGGNKNLRWGQQYCDL